MGGSPQASSSPSSSLPTKSWRSFWGAIAMAGAHFGTRRASASFTNVSMIGLHLIEWREKLRRPLALTNAYNPPSD